MTIQRRRRAEGDQQERPDISIEPKTKVWIEYSGRFIMGDGGLHLLRAIRARGSLTLAGREVGWSYRHAWDTSTRGAGSRYGAYRLGAREGHESGHCSDRLRRHDPEDPNGAPGAR